MDFNDINKIEATLVKALKEQKALVQPVANAITVMEYDSDYRKALLARLAAPWLVNGKSVSAAEMLARSDKNYIDDMHVQQKFYQDAVAVRKEWDNLQNRIDAGRSFLARARETIHNFKE